MKLDIMSKAIFEYQTPATLNQANPVQDTKYTILDTTSNARIYQIAVNIEDANEDLTVTVTIDGETITGSVTATHSTTYYVVKALNAVSRTDALVIEASAGGFVPELGAFQLEGKSIKIQVEKDTNNGAGNLTGIVTYGVLKSC